MISVSETGKSEANVVFKMPFIAAFMDTNLLSVVE
jgi:hypothetical protein